MNSDSASLANLRDIVMPPPVSWWPLAPGWWFLLAVASLFAVLALVHLGRRWRANAYRRAALHELRNAESVAVIAEVLKRAALAATPRTEAASLAGPDWIDWLAKTGGRPVPTAVSEALTIGVYADRGSTQISEVTAYAAEWIRSHKLSPPMREGH
jgi:hypothetical protein